MKTKIILIALGIILLGVTTGAVAGQYQKYKQEQALATSQANKKEADAKTAHQVEINSLNARITLLKAECNKGALAYGLLPLATRTKTLPPNCQVLEQ